MESVLIGYGSVKKSDITGALSRVTADVIQERPTQNLFQALQGKAAGVHISSNFKPGELPIVRIRGTRSLEADNDPLYVIDGIPLVSGSISDISPNDIASIEVLKDASATAIYGSRGANGVVLIQTKRGTPGQLNITYNGTVSLDSYKSLTDWMNGGQYIDRWRLSLMNAGLYETAQFTDYNTPVIPGYPDPNEDVELMALAQDPIAMESVLMGYEWEDEIGGTVRMRPTTAEEQAMGWPAQVPVYNSSNIRSYDWISDAVRQGVTNNHQIAVSTGNETSNLYLSFNYFDQVGVQRDQDYERFTATINGDIKPTNWLRVGASAIASLSIQNYGIFGPNTSNTGSKDLYSRATDQFPYALPKDADGNWIRNPGGNLSLWNPLIDIDQSVNERRASSVMTSLFAEVKLTPWLQYRMNVGSQLRNYRVGTWTGPNATSHLTTRPNTASYSNEERFSWVVENLLYIDKTFADVHKIGITLLQSAQKFRRENINARVSSTTYDISYWYDLASNTNGSPDSYGTGFSENTLMSWMGRINYSLVDRYLLTVTGRYDGASVLAPGHKWHFFPSFAVAWKMHEEPFMAGLSWLNELKPRVGYGVTGNSSVDPYTTSGPLSRNPYVFGSVPAISYLPQLVKNPLLEWERTAELNIGIDFAIIGSRISGSLEYYEANTNNLILAKDLPAVSGYVRKLENVGATRNRGFEVTLTSVNIQKGDFSWTTDLNWARNREEIVELLNGKQDMLAQRWFIGHPLQVYYQYDNDGIWQNTAEDLEEMAKFNANGHDFYPGTIKVVDQNGDYRITGDDQVIRGTNRPDWTGGITNTFRYKNWTLSSFIYARVGQTYFGGYPNSYGGVWPNGRIENDVWSWNNPGGRWPMPNFGDVENITAAMQYNDGSFAVVRNISLTYTVPDAFLQRISVKDLSLNVQVLNPFIFGGEVVKWGLNPDDDTNWDRASSNTNPLGGTNNNTILPQSIVFGIRAGF
jgi:TonB-linked SusC/RagA family outer membrane protein